MTTNLAGSINLVSKGTRYLPIITIVKKTCRKLGILFAKRGIEEHAMITFSQKFGKLFNKSLTNTMAKSITHHVESYDLHNQIFTMTKTINPHEFGRPPRRFKVYLEAQ